VTKNESDSIAGPASAPGTEGELQMSGEEAQAMRRISDATQARLAAEDQVEVTLFRHVFGETAYAGINGVSYRIPADSRPHKVPKSIAELLLHRQNHDLAAEAERQRLSGRS
jgi:hypothetical protein